MLSSNVGLLADDRHDVTAARCAAESPFCMLQLLHFLYISPKLHFYLEPDYIARKPIKQCFQQYLVRREILSTFYTSRIHFSANNTSFQSTHSNEWGTNAKKSKKQPLPLEARGPHLIHQCLEPPHSPSQTASVSNWPFCYSTLSGLTDRPTDRQMV